MDIRRQAARRLPAQARPGGPAAPWPGIRGDRPVSLLTGSRWHTAATRSGGDAPAAQLRAGVAGGPWPPLLAPRPTAGTSQRPQCHRPQLYISPRPRPRGQLPDVRALAPRGHRVSYEKVRSVFMDTLFRQLLLCFCTVVTSEHHDLGAARCPVSCLLYACGSCRGLGAGGGAEPWVGAGQKQGAGPASGAGAGPVGGAGQKQRAGPAGGAGRRRGLPVGSGAEEPGGSAELPEPEPREEELAEPGRGGSLLTEGRGSSCQRHNPVDSRRGHRSHHWEARVRRWQLQDTCGWCQYPEKVLGGDLVMPEAGTGKRLGFCKNL